MLKGLIIEDDGVTIAKIIEEIIEINEKEKTITHSSGKLGGINFNFLNLFATDYEGGLEVGEPLSVDLVNLADSIKVQTPDDLIDSLGKEMINLKMGFMMLKGGSI